MILQATVTQVNDNNGVATVCELCEDVNNRRVYKITQVKDVLKFGDVVTIQPINDEYAEVANAY